MKRTSNKDCFSFAFFQIPSISFNITIYIQKNDELNEKQRPAAALTKSVLTPEGGGERSQLFVILPRFGLEYFP